MSDVPIKSVDRAALDILLVHLVRCPEVLTQAIAKLKIDDFDTVTERGHQLIWAVVSDFYLKHQRAMPRQILLSELSSRMAGVPEYEDQNIRGAVFQQVEFVYGAVEDKDLVPSYAVNILGSFLYERHVVNKLMQSFQRGNLTRSDMEEIRRAEEGASVTRSPLIEPFRNDMVGVEPRDDTGIPFLSVMMGGGARRRDLYGFIAPSAGGKTTFGNQLAIAYAMRKRHVFVFSYEEPITNEYFIPVYACAAKIERSKVEAMKSVDDLTPEERKRWLQAKESIGTYLHYVDMKSSAGDGGPPEIQAYLINSAARGIKADMFILDWFWPMLQRYSASGGVKSAAKNREERSIGQQVIDELKQVVTRQNCWGWINHQTAPSEAVKKRDMTWTDAAEFKSFAWYLTGCFSLTMQSGDGLATLNYSKARTVKSSKTLVQMKGNIATFVAANQDFVFDERLKKYQRPEDKNVIPDELGRKNHVPAGLPVDDINNGKGVTGDA